MILQVRQRLRRDHGIEGGIPVVFSLEKPKAKLLPFKGPNGDEENPSDYQVRFFTIYIVYLEVPIFDHLSKNWLIQVMFNL